MYNLLLLTATVTLCTALMVVIVCGLEILLCMWLQHEHNKHRRTGR